MFNKCLTNSALKLNIMCSFVDNLTRASNWCLQTKQHQSLYIQPITRLFLEILYRKFKT